MKILGITHLEPFANYFHGTSVCLVADGIVEFAVAEERFTRIPQFAGYPSCSLNHIFERYMLSWKDIDAIALPWPEYGNTIEAMNSQLDSGHSFNGVPVLHVDHQTAHAYSVLPYCPFDSGYILTMDGMGFDDKQVSCGGLFKFSEDMSLRKEFIIERIGSSLGEFYGAVTTALGWTMLKDEGKLMALAGFGNVNSLIESVLSEIAPTLKGKFFQGVELGLTEPPIVNGRHNVKLSGQQLDIIHNLIAKYDRIAVAAAAQHILEERIVDFCTENIPQGSNLCLAGGLFLNIHVNRRLRESGYNIYTYPNPGDGGTAVGAALCVDAQKRGSLKSQDRTPVYLGPKFSTNEVRAVLDRCKQIGYWVPNNAEKEVAQRLKNGEVIGIFQGHAEWGPRALCNRSVLADPTLPKIKDRLNLILKQREEFQPFGAVMTMKAAEKILDNCCPSPFMIDVFFVKETHQHRVPALVHSDGSVRPQILKKSENEVTHKILGEFGKLSGIEALINTSLNMHGESICLTPMNAIHLLCRGGIDMLFMPPFLVTTSEKSKIMEGK